MKQKFKIAHMGAAYNYAKLSYCQRKKTGCVIVKGNGILSYGYNGTFPGEKNICEDENYVTKPNVIHAEKNAILKLSQCTESSLGAELFVTTSPCYDCAGLIILSGIEKVYYCEEYRDSSGIERLKEFGIEVNQIDLGSRNDNEI